MLRSREISLMKLVKEAFAVDHVVSGAAIDDEFKTYNHGRCFECLKAYCDEICAERCEGLNELDNALKCSFEFLL